jgi:hypothetical protein
MGVAPAMILKGAGLPTVFIYRAVALTGCAWIHASTYRRIAHGAGLVDSLD